MNLHFPTVPVEIARRKACDGDRVPPLILVVDDEPLIAETLTAILKGVGLAAIAATDAEAALETARVMPPHLLITDAAMPGLNGFDLAVEVKRIAPDCEIILFSGQPSTHDLAEEYNALGYNFVTLIKPVHPTDLLVRVFDRLGEHAASICTRNGPRRSNVREEIFPGSTPLGEKRKADFIPYGGLSPARLLWT
jgi:DNA-binding response OmpR family regulator